MNVPKEDATLLRIEEATRSFSLRQRGWRRQRVVALDGVSMTLRRGETVGLVGESGSGKSTLGRCVLNLTRLDSGRILYQGREIQALPRARVAPVAAPPADGLPEPGQFLQPDDDAGGDSAGRPAAAART